MQLNKTTANLSRRNKIIFVIGVGVIVLLVIVYSSIGYLNSKKIKQVNTIKYMDMEFYYEDGKSGVFKKQNGKTIKISDENINDIFIYNNLLFYTINNINGIIQVMDVNGGNCKRIFQGGGSISFNDFNEKELLFVCTKSTDSYIYKLNLSTFEHTQLYYKEYDDSGIIFSTRIFKGDLYYSLLGANTNTYSLKDNLMLCSGDIVFIIDDKMYISNLFVEDEKGYSKYNLDGSGKQNITDKEYESKNNEYNEQLKNKGFYKVLTH